MEKRKFVCVDQLKMKSMSDSRKEFFNLSLFFSWIFRESLEVNEGGRETIKQNEINLQETAFPSFTERERTYTIKYTTSNRQSTKITKRETLFIRSEVFTERKKKDFF